MIKCDDFAEYYRILGIGIFDDESFRKMIYGEWDLDIY